MTTRLALVLVAALALATFALPASAIWVSDCPQKCTPNCPCSIVCQGPFGPTTCGAAGEACTGLIQTNDPILTSNMTPAEADEDQVFLLELAASAQPTAGEAADSPAAD